MPFRFLDLPPELRNPVYGHALSHDRLNSPANVALLRVSRQINKEGRGILEAESTFTIVAKFTGRNLNDIDTEISGDITRVFVPDATADVLTYTQAFPKTLPRVAKLKLVLEFDGGMQCERTAHLCAANRFIYAADTWLNTLAGGNIPSPLAVSVQDSAHLKRFKTQADDKWHEIIQPFDFLSPYYQLTVDRMSPDTLDTIRTGLSAVHIGTLPATITRIQDFLRLAPLTISRFQHPDHSISLEGLAFRYAKFLNKRMALPHGSETTANRALIILCITALQIVNDYVYDKSPAAMALLRERLELVFRMAVTYRDTTYAAELTRYPFSALRNAAGITEAIWRSW